MNAPRLPETPSSRRGRPAAAPTHAFRLLSCLVGLLLVSLVLPTTVAAQQGPADDLLWQWQLLEYRADNGDDELTSVPAGIGVTAGLFADTITIEGACSTARTDFSLQGQESIAISPPVVEPRGCDPEAQAVDDAFYAGLAETSTWQTSGGCAADDEGCRPSILTFRDVVGNPVMRLTSAVLPPDPGLSRWDLGRIGTAEGDIAPVITGITPWIEFQRGGHVIGSSGCGSFLGDYTVDGDTMTITGIVPQAPDCTSALRDQSEAILATLGEITDFDILPAGLVLRDRAGLTRLAFVPAIDLENRTWTPFEVRQEGDVLADVSELLSTSAVRFAGFEADGRSYCRGFEGDRLSSGLALTVSSVLPDEGQRCPRRRREGGPTPQQIEDGFLEALARTASHALRGDELLLMDVDGAPVMRLTPQADLTGPTWVLDQIETTPNSRRTRPRTPVGDEPLTAVFSDVDIGVLRGSTGVRSYYAEYDVPGGSQIEISEPEAQGAGCGRRSRNPLCVQERLFLANLDAADVVVVRPFEMRLHRGQRVLLRFVPEDIYLARQAAAEEAASRDAES